jgi:hypothetical protein
MRIKKVTDQILKLQVLLRHDPYNSHSHLLKFFRKCFTLDQIYEFQDQGLQRFIDYVASFIELPGDITLKQFISHLIYDFTNVVQSPQPAVIN